MILKHSKPTSKNLILQKAYNFNSLQQAQILTQASADADFFIEQSSNAPHSFIAATASEVIFKDRE